MSMNDLFIDPDSSLSGPTAVVDPANYRSFCFRGEGRCNFVISAKESKSNLRIVWRLAKHRKSGTMTTKPKCEIVNGYLEKMVSPFLRDDYLIKAKIVHIQADHLHQLAKIPSLPHNFKIERWEELKDELKYPAESSFFPLHLIDDSLFSNAQYVCALEMPDATRIPRHIPFVYGPTITVEIKPKQGFFQAHPGVNVPFCNNCILQIEKWRSAAFDTMYDFCPLDLYSGERDRMRGSIRSLIHDPHRNLRIFVDGDVVHDEDSQLNRSQLNAVLFPHAAADVDTFISVIVCVLAGMTEEPSNPAGFYLRKDSVLSDLLRSQRTDTIGIVKAYEYFKSLPQSDQMELWNKSNLVKRGDGLSFLKKSDPRSLVEQYLLAASMKDCSLMLSVRLVAKSDLDNLRGNNKNPIPLIGVNGTDGKRLYFAHSIRIVDLDPKSAKNLENAYCRFTAGVEFLRSNPYIHKACKM